VTEGSRKQDRRIGKTGHRTAALLAWSVWVLCLALLALTVLLDHYYTPLSSDVGNTNMYALFAVPLLVYVTVGAFVASRRPRNLVGWMLCAIGFVLVAYSFGVAYADFALLAQAGAALPGGVYMACISQSLVALPALILAFTLLILLFPDGHLPDRSLLAVPWVAVGGGAASFLWAATADKVFGRYSVRNPLHVGGVLGDVVDGFGRLGAAALLVGLVVAIIAVFVRLGSAQGVERQRLKWFAYAAAVLLGSIFFGLPVAWLLPPWIGYPLGVAVFSAIPVAVGIAVLRYRLYDIDRIINRTLVYGALTALLAAGYFGSIMVLQGIGGLVYQVPFRALTGQESQLATIAATLVIAALFTPLRLRLQSFIDRRFYRSKYDTRKTLEAFSAQLRNETDLDALSADLVDVVRETVQPAHVTLWLRKPVRGRARTLSAPSRDIGSPATRLPR
jgi:hypothetical protein